ncbi:MAG: hypothetical protein HQ559_13780 [Lentisphaerae bacterium]|nr:hypothetical protein [Lentisphaerota bacterium]
MKQRERFEAVMGYRRFDRLPVWYFGQWQETTERWLREGLSSADRIPGELGMDPGWLDGMWSVQGLAHVWPIGNGKDEVISEDDSMRVVRNSLGGTVRESKDRNCTPHLIDPPLKPTRRSWKRFRTYLDPADPRRLMNHVEGRIDELSRRDGVATFLAGSLYGWPRDWMGVEALSYLSYDDPVLYEEIIDHITEFFIAGLRPVIGKAKLDIAYLFEDCAGSSGPLFSPGTYRKFYDRYYRRLVEFYHSNGVKNVLVDCDGKIDDLVPCWLDSGIDIVFPVEVGKWEGDPVALRAKYGKRLRMMGAVNKHVLTKGEGAVRETLERLRGLVAEGGYIPFPDHALPPDCSLDQFKVYLRIFKEVFGGKGEVECA